MRKLAKAASIAAVIAALAVPAAAANAATSPTPKITALGWTGSNGGGTGTLAFQTGYTPTEWGTTSTTTVTLTSYYGGFALSDPTNVWNCSGPVTSTTPEQGRYLNPDGTTYPTVYPVTVTCTASNIPDIPYDLVVNAPAPNALPQDVTVKVDTTVTDSLGTADGFAIRTMTY